MGKATWFVRQISPCRLLSVSPIPAAIQQALQQNAILFSMLLLYYLFPNHFIGVKFFILLTSLIYLLIFFPEESDPWIKNRLLTPFAVRNQS